MTSLSRIRLLNGETLLLESSPIVHLRTQVANALDVLWSQVTLTHDPDHEHEYLALILPKPIVSLPSSTSRKPHHHFWNHRPFLAKAVNTSLIKHYLSVYAISDYLSCAAFAELMKNPHPLVVDYLLVHFDEVIKHNKCVWANPDDRVVDRLMEECVSEPSFSSIWTQFSSNTNPRVVDFLITHHPDRIDLEAFSKSPHEHAVRFVWENEWYSHKVATNVESEWALLKQIELAETEKGTHYTNLMTRLLYQRNGNVNGRGRGRGWQWLMEQIDKQHTSTRMDQRFELPGELLALSADCVVDWLFHPKRFEWVLQIPHALNYLSKNSNPIAVDWILADAQNRAHFPEFFQNAHPRAVEYCKQRMMGSTLCMESVLKNSNTDLLVWVIHTSPESIDFEKYLEPIKEKLCTTDTVEVEFTFHMNKTN